MKMMSSAPDPPRGRQLRRLPVASSREPGPRAIDVRGLYVDIPAAHLTVTSTTFIGDMSLLSSIHDGQRYTSGVWKYSP